MPTDGFEMEQGDLHVRSGSDPLLPPPPWWAVPVRLMYGLYQAVIRRSIRRACPPEPDRHRVAGLLTFTALDAVLTAQEDAERLRDAYIGIGHLLVALGSETGGIAAQVLSSAGIDHALLERARSFLAEEPRHAADGLNLTEGVRAAVALAGRETLCRGYGSVSTGHLLLTVLDHAGEALQSVGIKLDEVREATLQVLEKCHGEEV